MSFVELCQNFTDLHAKHFVLCARGDVLMGLSTGDLVFLVNWRTLST